MPMKRITIEPVSRIEGHAKITIQLDDAGKVADTRFQVTQVRGFEKFTEGRPFYEMPGITSRICGICPISHQLASSKACEAIMAVRIPRPAQLLREIVHCAQIVQSHALSFFYLAAPDLLLGMDAEPAQRNIYGLMKTNPEFVRDGVRLRQFGQEIIELLAGKRLHPTWIVPGGVTSPLSPETKNKILTSIPEAMNIIQRTLNWYKTVVDNYREEIRTFATFPSLFMGLVTPTGA